MRDYARIAARLYDQPLLIMPDAAITIANVLAERLGMPYLESPGGSELRSFHSRALHRAFAGDDDDDLAAPDVERLYDIRNGFAIIPVQGELINRGSWLSSFSGLTSYEGLSIALKAARDDGAIQGILLDVDSPGGEAANAIETGALVRDVAKQKPVVAYVNSLNASAAYAITSGASHIVSLPSGSSGSIGVVRLHRENSVALAKAGIKPTLIHAGAYKVDGSSMHPLSDDARSRMQASVDQLYDFFVAHVAAMRGLPESDVRATEGGLLIGRKALDAGLVDQLGSMDDAFSYLSRGRTKAPPLLSGVNMAVETETTAGAVAPVDTKALIEAERKRALAIMNAPEAKGRESMAQHLAFNTGMSADEAIALLKCAPAASAAVTAPAAEAQASNRLVVPVPSVQPDEHQQAAQADAAAPWDKIAADLNKAAAFSHPNFRAPVLN